MAHITIPQNSIPPLPAQDAHNLLRPETLESLFLLWRVTRRREYREQVQPSAAIATFGTLTLLLSCPCIVMCISLRCSDIRVQQQLCHLQAALANHAIVEMKSIQSQVLVPWLQAWAIFRAFEKHCRVESGGYAGLDSVLAVPPAKRDRMESFWLAESLKYLWLLFSDDGRFHCGCRPVCPSNCSYWAVLLARRDCEESFWLAGGVAQIPVAAVL